MAQQRSIALTISVSKEATRSEAVSAEEGLPGEMGDAYPEKVRLSP